MADDDESRKSLEYRSLAAVYRFVPVAVEMLGALEEEASAVFRDFDHRIAAVTSEPRSHQFLLQRLSRCAAWQYRLRAQNCSSVKQTGRSFSVVV